MWMNVSVNIRTERVYVCEWGVAEPHLAEQYIHCLQWAWPGQSLRSCTPDCLPPGCWRRAGLGGCSSSSQCRPCLLPPAAQWAHCINARTQPPRHRFFWIVVICFRILGYIWSKTYLIFVIACNFHLIHSNYSYDLAGSENITSRQVNKKDFGVILQKGSLFRIPLWMEHSVRPHILMVFI